MFATPSGLIAISGPFRAERSAVPDTEIGVTQPNNNLAPQLGVAWDPKSDGKTVIRAGIGIYYDNTVFQRRLV